jgi:hypothetical protein
MTDTNHTALITSLNSCSLTKGGDVYIYIPTIDMQQTPLPVNHIALNGIHQPMQPSTPLKKLPVTVSLPERLIERLRNAVYWTGDRPLAILVAEAIEDIVTQMEEVNGGAFPQRVFSLKRGRRPRKTLRGPLDDQSS